MGTGSDQGTGRSLSIALLGPLEVRVSGRPIVLGSGRQRIILAALTLCAGEPAVVDELADAVWPTGPPATWQGTLQTHVSRLRSALASAQDGKPLIEYGATGYRLCVDPSDIDIGRFEHALERAQSAPAHEAASLLDRALALWRGEALVDFRYEPFAQMAIVRLQELRASAIEDRIELHLQSGRPDDVIPILKEFVERHPYRERLWAQLARALYGAGRQAEALRTLQRVRAMLDEDLGVAPGPELRQMESQLREQRVEPLGRDESGRPELGPLTEVPRRSDVAGPPIDVQLHCSRLLDRAERLRRAGEPVASRRMFASAAGLAEDNDLTDLLVEATLGLAGAPEDVPEGDDALVDDAALLARLERLGRFPAVEAVVQARRALIDLSGRAATSAKLARAEHAARAGGMARTIAYVLRTRSRLHFYPDALDGRLEDAIELVHLGSSTGDQQTETWGHRWLTIQLPEAGRIDEAATEGAWLEQAARDQRDPFHEWGAAVRLAGLDVLHGRLSQAQARLDHCLVLVDELESGHARSCTSIVLAFLALWQGRIEESYQLLEPLPPSPLNVEVVRPWFLLSLDRREEAARLLAAALEGGTSGLPVASVDGVTDLLQWAVLGETAARLGALDRAEPLLAGLLPYRSRGVVVHPGLVVFDHAGRPLGLLAEALGRPAVADDLWDEAEAWARRAGAPGILARLLLDRAAALAARGGTAATASARQRREEAEAIADEFGLAVVPLTV